MPPPTSPRPDPISPEFRPKLSAADLLQLAPVPLLISRLRSELGGSFDAARPIRISRAPGRLDVMGGIADYTGGLVCQSTLDRAAAVALQARDDRQVQIFSFNLFDEHRPFTIIVPIEALTLPLDQLRREFAQGGRHWGGYVAGCLAILHDERLIDLRDPAVRGVNLALLSTVPAGAGVSSSAAIEVATMINLVDHYLAPGRLNDATSTTENSITPMRIAAMCRRAGEQVAGALCSIKDQAASCAGESDALMRMKCQPHELEDPLFLPGGVRAIGIYSGVNRGPGEMYAITRCAAFMGHKIILDTMKKMGATAGREMIGDPTSGYLANLPLDDYKKYFRAALPESMKGGQFLLTHGSTIDRAAAVRPDLMYHVQSATDHHVFEAHRVREFVRHLHDASAAAEPAARKLALDKAGHLMYASHISYTRDAKLGADECDLLVELARQREPAGIYGAKITGGGSGGTVAVLCEQGERVDAAIEQLMTEYERRTGLKPEAFLASSPGAWAAGTAVI